MISVRHKGDFSNIEKLLKKSLGRNYRELLRQYGERGVAALAAATPKKTGKTASSWSYEIVETKDTVSVHWFNTNVQGGYANVAILIQCGHGTRNGGYVEGIDYINPALKPIFQELADAAWKEVTAK